MDKISNLIINIKNAGNAGKEHASVPFSNFKMEVAEVLKREGYLKDVSKKGKKPKFSIEMELAYNPDGTPRVNDVKRVSKPSKRVYFGISDIRPVKGGYGILVISTPKGILTDKQARKEKVGGEALFKIW